MADARPPAGPWQRRRLALLLGTALLPGSLATAWALWQPLAPALVGAAALGGALAAAWLAWRANSAATADRKAGPPAPASEARAEAALMSTVAASMAQGLAVWDAEGRLLVSNERHRRLLDLPERLARRGTHFLDVARLAAARGEYGPGDPETLARARLSALLGGTATRLTRLRQDGTVLEIATQPMPGGGAVATLTDTTERHAAEHALRESEGRFRLLAEHSGDVVILADMAGTQLYVSPACRHVLGWPPEALIGRMAGVFVHPEDSAWVDAVLAALREGAEEGSATYRHTRPDGGWRWVEVHARAHAGAGPGQPAGYVATLRDATERKRAEAELLSAYEEMEAMASTDALTGIANRRRLEAALEGEWRRATREQLPLSVLLIDVDHFKRFNDRYGHPAGDVCLRDIAAALGRSAKRPGDLAARMGGEEFALLLPGTEAEGAAHVAERLCRAVHGLGIPHAGNAAGVATVSIGVATIHPQPGTGEQERDLLLSAADRALYAAKHGGRNRIAVADPLLVEGTLPGG